MASRYPDDYDPEQEWESDNMIENEVLTKEE